MKNDPSNKHLALAHVWLFQANVDPECIDTEGRPRAESLARVFDSVEKDAQKPVVETRCNRESGIRAKVKMRPRLELVRYDDEPTGEYDFAELERLVEEAKQR